MDDFKLGNGFQIAFWLDSWLDNTPLIICCPQAQWFCVITLGFFLFLTVHFLSKTVKGRRNTGFSNFTRPYFIQKGEPYSDRRIWSLEANGKFLVKSLVTHLSLASPLDKLLVKAHWKSKSPRRVNITVWIMLSRSLNISSVLQRKLPSHYLFPSAFAYAWQTKRIFSICFLIVVMLINVDLDYLIYLT